MKHYAQLAELFIYPSMERHLEKIRETQEFLNEKYPVAGNELKRFSEWVENTPMDEQEELFTKTFHIQAICYLDIGYVMFGEDYKRGEFLGNMKVEQEGQNVDCGDELWDNIVNVLKLISVHKDPKFVEELCVGIFIPAVKKMLIEFDVKLMENRIKYLKKTQKVLLLENIQNGNIYQNALNALLSILQADFGHLIKEYKEYVQEVPEFSKDFVGDCSTCAPKLNFNKIRKS